jgi:hypothetical protein
MVAIWNLNRLDLDPTGIKRPYCPATLVVACSALVLLFLLPVHGLLLMMMPMMMMCF